MLGQEGVSDSHASQIEADDPRTSGAERVDHLKASSTQVDVETGTWATGKTPGRESNQAALFVSTEELNGESQNLGGGEKERFGVFGSAKCAGSDGNRFVRSKSPDSSLELGEDG